MQATCIEWSLTVGYLYLLYIFLTLLRNVAMGTATASARLSAFASAYAPLLVSGLLHAFNLGGEGGGERGVGSLSSSSATT